MPQIIILGFHRSGTSLVAGILHHLGVFMGEDLIGSNEYNSAGYFEDRAFMEMNGRIFKDKGNWERVPTLEYLEERWEAEVEGLVSLLHERNSKYETWGWKEPQTCLTFPAYVRHLSDPRIIVTHRSRDAIIKSLCNREKHYDRYMAHALLLEYLEVMYHGFSKLSPRVPILHVSYEYLVNTKNVWPLAEFVDKEVANKAYDFIDPSLNHANK